MSAVYVNGGFRIFSVTAGSDRLAQNVYSSSGWSGWQDLANDGEALSGSPGVAYDSGDGSMHVFALGKNGAVYQDTLTSSGGSTWGSLGGGLQGGLQGGLSAVYEGGGFHVFSVSPSGNLYQDTWGSASGWTWVTAGTRCTPRPESPTTPPTVPSTCSRSVCTRRTCTRPLTLRVRAGAASRTSAAAWRAESTPPTRHRELRGDE